MSFDALALKALQEQIDENARKRAEEAEQEKTAVECASDT